MPNRAAASRSLLPSACLATALWSMAVASPLLAQDAAPKPLFPEGPCSGVLCGIIGGSQAPAAQPPQKSLFREGECGGILCSAIGGPQAPKHAEAPPPCGGGLLCDLTPYAMGVPVTASEAARLQAEHERQVIAQSPPVTPAKAERAPSRHRSKHARSTVAKASEK